LLAVLGQPNWKAVAVALVAASVFTACLASPPTNPAVDCAALPDAAQMLAQAWKDYQPDQPLSPAVNARKRLFAFQALLLSAGMYAEPASDPATVYAQYAPQFVRDFGMTRNPALESALSKLSATLQQVRERSERDLGDNCGLILARRMLRDDPVNISTDWVLQRVTWGLAAMFQTSIRQMVHEYAQSCRSAPDADTAPESVLACTMRRAGL
jgi:hypothetical protein